MTNIHLDTKATIRIIRKLHQDGLLSEVAFDAARSLLRPASYPIGRSIRRHAPIRPRVDSSRRLLAGFHICGRVSVRNVRPPGDLLIDHEPYSRDREGGL